MLQLSNTFRVLEPFFLAPAKKLYLLGISRRIGLAHTSVKRELDSLVKDGLLRLEVEKRGSRKFPMYSANTTSRGFIMEKQLYNLRSILGSGLIQRMEEKLSPKAIVLFGSYFRGEDVEESDIDLFVECKKESLELSRLERKLGRKIELHFFESFSDCPKELRNSVINGIALSGFLEGWKA